MQLENTKVPQTLILTDIYIGIRDHKTKEGQSICKKGENYTIQKHRNASNLNFNIYLPAT